MTPTPSPKALTAQPEGLETVLGQVELAASARPGPPFDAATENFLDDFAADLRRRPESSARPDLAALAFWCRRASVREMKAASGLGPDRLGRGPIFHIAPGNVAVNFAYSLVLGLLTGNSNILRLPGRRFPQTDIIIQSLEEVLSRHPEMRPRICLVRYERRREINDYLSGLCRTRLIWGGDRTIEEIRRSPLPTRALDLAFADRYGLALIQADRYLERDDYRQLAEKFYNDTLRTDQNACSSPALVVWLGEKTAEAREKFWSQFEAAAAAKYELQPAQAVDKLSRFLRLCALRPGVRKVSGEDNLVFRAEVDSLAAELMDLRGTGGYFMEYTARSLAEVLPVCGDRCQTWTVLGLDPGEIESFLQSYAPAGPDRIVPLGRTLDFSLQWDGYDLPALLTRVLYRPSQKTAL